MSRMLLLVAIALGLAALSAQSKPQSTAPAAAKPAAAAPAQTVADENWSGMYTFLQDGDYVQLDFQPGGRLDGFISRLGSGKSDSGVVLTQFIKSGAWKDHDVSFTTTPVHGTWYEFKGRLDRGAGKTLADDGYFIVKGTLAENAQDEEKKASRRSRELTLKSFPRDEPAAAKQN